SDRRALPAERDLLGRSDLWPQHHGRERQLDYARHHDPFPGARRQAGAPPHGPSVGCPRKPLSNAPRHFPRRQISELRFGKSKSRGGLALADFVKIEKGFGPEGRIAVVRFDRGDGINAMSPEALRQLTEAAR